MLVSGWQVRFRKCSVIELCYKVFELAFLFSIPLFQFSDVRNQGETDVKLFVMGGADIFLQSQTPVNFTGKGVTTSAPTSKLNKRIKDLLRAQAEEAARVAPTENETRLRFSRFFRFSNRVKKSKKMKGKAKFGKNVTEKDKQAQEEAKYQEETRTLGVIDRSLDEHHVGELMNNFYTSGKPNDKIEWVGWLQDTKDNVTFEKDFGLDNEDNDLMEPPAFCDRDTVNEWTKKWKAAGLIDCKGGKLDWNNIPLDKRTELQTFLSDKMKEGKLPMEAFVGLHTSNAIQRLHRIHPTQPLWQEASARLVRSDESAFEDGKRGRPRCPSDLAETELETGNARSMMGDMFKMASLLPSNSAFDCLYADLPYNISELVDDQEEIHEEKVKTLLNAFSVVGNSEKRAVVFHCHPSQYNMLVEALSVTGYQTIETVYWYKKNHNYVGDVQKWIKAVEMMLVAFNPKQASFTLNLDPNPINRHNIFVVEVPVKKQRHSSDGARVNVFEKPTELSKQIWLSDNY
eukprot:g14098.t1